MVRLEVGDLVRGLRGVVGPALDRRTSMASRKPKSGPPGGGRAERGDPGRPVARCDPAARRSCGICRPAWRPRLPLLVVGLAQTISRLRSATHDWSVRQDLIATSALLPCNPQLGPLGQCHPFVVQPSTGGASGIRRGRGAIACQLRTDRPQAKAAQGPGSTDRRRRTARAIRLGTETVSAPANPVKSTSGALVQRCGPVAPVLLPRAFLSVADRDCAVLRFHPGERAPLPSRHEPGRCRQHPSTFKTGRWRRVPTPLVDREFAASLAAAMLERELAVKLMPGRGPIESPSSANCMLTVEVDREDDRRWIAEVVALLGVQAYGDTRDKAIGRVEALSLRMLAIRLP
jgi:hypothetical protein